MSYVTIVDVSTDKEFQAPLTDGNTMHNLRVYVGEQLNDTNLDRMQFTDTDLTLLDGTSIAALSTQKLLLYRCTSMSVIFSLGKSKEKP